MGIWSFVSLFCLAVVAYWVYEDGKRIEFLEEHLWRKIDKLEQSVKINIGDIENLEKIQRSMKKEKAEKE